MRVTCRISWRSASVSETNRERNARMRSMGAIAAAS
jgi:hypothetical protein